MTEDGNVPDDPHGTPLSRAWQMAGLDPYDPADLKEIVATIEWLRDERKRAISLADLRPKFVIAGLSSLLAVAGTFAIDWIKSRFFQ